MDERRRFFRITDTLGVAYRVLSEEELAAQPTGLNTPVNLFSLLASYDIELSEQLTKLQGRDPLVADLLELMNKKMTSLINHLVVENGMVERIAHQLHEVNISACGIAFLAEEKLPVGSTLSLDLLLHPKEIHIFSYGTVVGVDTDDDGHYLRVDFKGMSPADQEVLIQHIVQRQSALIREMREGEQQPMRPN